MNLTPLGASYKWNYTVLVLLLGFYLLLGLVLISLDPGGQVFPPTVGGSVGGSAVSVCRRGWPHPEAGGSEKQHLEKTLKVSTTFYIHGNSVWTSLCNKFEIYFTAHVYCNI